MSRSKSIGTQGETAVVNYAKGHGFPDAERLPLKGSLDEGDVRLRKGIHLEVKAGDMAHSASYNQCLAWLGEATREGIIADADCYLVVKRKGCGDSRVELWRAFMWMSLRKNNLSPFGMVELSFEDLLIGLRL
jgi:hypothetical protein